MEKNQRPDQQPETCFYCDAVMTTTSLERDHFPIPAYLGGTHTVACCEVCHSMKDRIPLAKWPKPWTVQILRDFPKMGRATRIFLAKAIRLMYETPGMLDLQADFMRQCRAVETELKRRSELYPNPPSTENPRSAGRELERRGVLPPAADTVPEE